jgi:hypothetical protein
VRRYIAARLREAATIAAAVAKEAIESGRGAGQEEELWWGCVQVESS